MSELTWAHERPSEVADVSALSWAYKRPEVDEPSSATREHVARAT